MRYDKYIFSEERGDILRPTNTHFSPAVMNTNNILIISRYMCRKSTSNSAYFRDKNISLLDRKWQCTYI